MAEILLTSENFVKSTTSISDNLAGKYMQPSIREAQDIAFRGIVGDALLAKLKELVRDNAIGDAGNEAYKDLLDNAQYFLAYQTVVNIIEKVTYKVTNFGLAKSTDENLAVADADEIAGSKFYWQSKADACCLDLQNWLLDNRAALPELTECACHKIQANLRSAASCGIFLGGRRGKGTPGRRCGR